MDADLLPCPFCGEAPEMEPWHGGKPTKQMVSCANDACAVQPQVTGETPALAAEAWNQRPTPSAPAPSEAQQFVVRALPGDPEDGSCGDPLGDDDFVVMARPAPSPPAPDALALVYRLDAACHQEVDEAVYDHPYVVELRESARLAAVTLFALSVPMPEREALAVALMSFYGPFPERTWGAWLSDADGVIESLERQSHLARLGGKEKTDGR